MKVERKGHKEFEPITIILETEQEALYMQTIAYIKVKETLEETCEREEQDLRKVDTFGSKLGDELENFLDC